MPGRRPCSSKTANRFSCDIFVEQKMAEKVNGNIFLGLMMLAAGPGGKLTVHAEGNDASQALAEIETLIKRKIRRGIIPSCNLPCITAPFHAQICRLA